MSELENLLLLWGLQELSDILKGKLIDITCIYAYTHIQIHHILYFNSYDIYEYVDLFACFTSHYYTFPNKRFGTT